MKYRHIGRKPPMSHDSNQLEGWELLSASAKNIATLEPRFHDYLFLAQVLTDELTRIQNNRPHPQIVVKHIESIGDLLHEVQEFKSHIVQLPAYVKQFNLVLQTSVQAALGGPGEPGNKRQIVTAVRELALAYEHVAMLGNLSSGRRREYAPAIAAELVHAVEPVLASVWFYFERERRNVLTFIEKFGPVALGRTWTASRQVEAGRDPGEMNMFTHRHHFSAFDTTQVEALTDLFNRLSEDSFDDTNEAEIQPPHSLATCEPRHGFIYLLTNVSMPGLVKLGRTKRSALDRVRELSSATGVPTPFEVIFELPVSDCESAERIAHQLLEDYRPSSTREFFQISTSQAIHTMLQAASLCASAPAPP